VTVTDVQEIQTAAPEIDMASSFMTCSQNPGATSQDERHGDMKPFQIRSTIFLGTVLVAIVGYSGIALKLHTPAAVRTKEMQHQRTLSELQARAHTRLTAAAYDPHSTPEMRAAALAIRERVDTLFYLDARLGINETGIFLRQESARWERLIHAPAGLRSAASSNSLQAAGID
jgi:hypothetical protein